MIKISHSFTVNRPVSEVFQFLTDAGNVFQYSRSIEEVRQLTPGNISVGARYALISKFMGRRVDMEIEVVEFEVDRVLVSKSISGPFDLYTRTLFQAEGENTVVTQASDIVPKGFWRTLMPILPGMIRKQSEAETATLRELLETRMHEVDEEMDIINISKTVVSVEGE